MKGWDKGGYGGVDMNDLTGLVAQQVAGKGYHGGIDMNELASLVAQKLAGGAAGGGGWSAGAADGGWHEEAAYAPAQVSAAYAPPQGGKGSKGGKSAKGGTSGKGGKGGKGGISVKQEKPAVNVHLKVKGQGPAAEVPFKSILCSVASKANPSVPLVKGIFHYDSAEMDGGYISTLSSEFLQGVYTTASTAASKKQAEENCAMQAVQAEYPHEFARAPNSVKTAARNLTAKVIPSANAGPPAKGNAKAKMQPKAKAQAAKVPTGEVLQFPKGTPNGSAGEDPKSKLSQMFCVLNGFTPPVKGDVEYTVEDVGGRLQATVTLKLPTGVQAFAGDVAVGTSKESGKTAKQHAATQAMAALNADYEAKLPELEWKKEQKKAARQEKLMEKYGSAWEDQAPAAKMAKR